MKKIIIPIIASCVAFLPSCSEDNLEIEQKGVISIDNYYQNDEDAEAAMVAVYQGFIWNMCAQSNGFIYSPFRAAFNNCGDDMFAAGEFLGDNDFMASMNEFRYDNGNQVIDNCYKNIYYAMYYTNLVIDHFKDGLPSGEKTATTKRVVAESRVLRAYMHMMLGIGWGTPPIIDHVLTGSAQPENAASQEELFKWCAQECVESEPDLIERESPSDKSGAARVTKGFANAVAGKCYMFLKDWDNAKKCLKKVIDSGKYELVSGDRFVENFHRAGDLNEEKIFEGNIDYAESIDNGSNWINRTTWMEANIWNWRGDHCVLSPTTNYSSIDGWGGLGVPKSFIDEFIKNDGENSYRFKATVVPIEDVMFAEGATHACYGETIRVIDTVVGDAVFAKVDASTIKEIKNKAKEVVGHSAQLNLDNLTKEEKAKLTSIGIKTFLYGQSLYLPLKQVAQIADLTKQGQNFRMNNFIIMRYAEVLLMYAEACLQSGNAGEALTYINMTKERAGAPLATSADMDVLKTEKKCELWLEGCRWADMKRWGDFDLAKKAGTEVTTLYDDLFYSKEKAKADGFTIVETSPTGRFYTVYAKEAQGRETGFQEGKHELFPFPQSVTLLNGNLKQNPGW
ncbi:MAG: RagB/SusD family nutrient uptake outer membrane protein [Salinivirgaceae bacterium]|nr:RagB/SusD family nutrient uptake outer membrane protein [Salinivirgaceae bacterium]